MLMGIPFRPACKPRSPGSILYDNGMNDGGMNDGGMNDSGMNDGGMYNSDMLPSDGSVPVHPAPPQAYPPSQSYLPSQQAVPQPQANPAVIPATPIHPVEIPSDTLLEDELDLSSRRIPAPLGHVSAQAAMPPVSSRMPAGASPSAAQRVSWSEVLSASPREQQAGSPNATAGLAMPSYATEPAGKPIRLGSGESMLTND